MNHLPEFTTIFNLTPEFEQQFWYYVRWLLFLVAPALMMVVALKAGEKFIEVLKNGLGISKKKDDDDDIYWY